MVGLCSSFWDTLHKCTILDLENLCLRTKSVSSTTVRAPKYFISANILCLSSHTLIHYRNICLKLKKYNCRLHDLFSEQSMSSTMLTTTARSPLKIGSLVQLSEVEFAVYPISFELITSKHIYHR